MAALDEKKKNIAFNSFYSQKGIVSPKFYLNHFQGPLKLSNYVQRSQNGWSFWNHREISINLSEKDFFGLDKPETSFEVMIEFEDELLFSFLLLFFIPLLSYFLPLNISYVLSFLSFALLSSVFISFFFLWCLFELHPTSTN